MRYDVLRELVEIPSVSGNEQAVAEFVAERCQSLRHTVTLLGDSVAVHIPGENQAKAVVINGHLDTVPPTDQWTMDPFVLHADPADEDRLIGLGASDMKSGDAIMIEIAKRSAEQRPPCDVWLVFSSMEEVDSSGSILAADWLAQEIAERYQAIGGVILEPTNAEFVGVGHRGDTLWDVIAQGSGGHASQHFDNEPTAIEKVSNLITALPSLRTQLAEYSDDILGTPSINATIVTGGQTSNVVPREARACLNLRVTPQLKDYLPEVRAQLEQVHDVIITQAFEPSPTRCDEDELIYRVARAAMPDMVFQAFPGATDQFAFHAHNIPMLIYGPGDPTAMHQPDEWVRRSAIVRCRSVVESMIGHFSNYP